MIKTIFLYLLFPVFLSAQTKHIESVLYEIKSKNGEKTSYLFGHTENVKADYLEKYKPVFEAVENSENILLTFEEINDEIDIFMKGTSLYDIMSRNEIDFLKETLDSFGYDFNFYLFTYPVVTALTLITFSQYDLQTLELEVLNEEVSGFEQSIRSLAKNSNIHLESIVSFNDFFQVITTNLSILEQKELLIEALDYIYLIENFTKSSNTKLNDCFNDNDIECMNRLLDYYIPGLKISETILKFLNPISFQFILERIENQNLFIAAFLDQLPFENGLIDLLKKEGYEVNPIKF